MVVPCHCWWGLIEQVHLDYLEAGADIIITASYQVLTIIPLTMCLCVRACVWNWPRGSLEYGQATIQGFEAKGFSSEESEALLRKSVEIACEARDIYYERCQEVAFDGSSDGRVLKQRPILVAASVGSYGAYLADGSEYRWVNLLLKSSDELHCYWYFLVPTIKHQLTVIVLVLWIFCSTSFAAGYLQSFLWGLKTWSYFNIEGFVGCVMIFCTLWHSNSMGRRVYFFIYHVCIYYWAIYYGTSTNTNSSLMVPDCGSMPFVQMRILVSGKL